ncbi:hypothetical protein TrST_g12202 [Triparma strigata]|uniref:Uncharacterized protein n=2 Tax=Triparma strigata TaxID=1606541 RepID=A0A9W7DTN0_9STRA|nr:hypothetical protein TrST_g12202 [Triparma strigata]
MIPDNGHGIPFDGVKIEGLVAIKQEQEDSGRGEVHLVEPPISILLRQTQKEVTLMKGAMERMEDDMKNMKKELIELKQCTPPPPAKITTATTTTTTSLKRGRSPSPPVVDRYTPPAPTATSVAPAAINTNVYNQQPNYANPMAQQQQQTANQYSMTMYSGKTPAAAPSTGFAPAAIAVNAVPTPNAAAMNPMAFGGQIQNHYQQQQHYPQQQAGYNNSFNMGAQYYQQYYRNNNYNHNGYYQYPQTGGYGQQLYTFPQYRGYGQQQTQQGQQQQASQQQP